MESRHDVPKTLGFENFTDFLRRAQVSQDISGDSAMVKNLCCACQ